MPPLTGRLRVVRYAGGPGYVNIGDQVATLMKRQVQVPYRRRAARGGFRATYDFSKVYRGVDAALEVADRTTAAQGYRYAQDISPHITGRYKREQSVEVYSTAGKRGRTPHIRMEAKAPYSFYVEFGGGHTPAHAVMRRSLDYMAVLYPQNLGAAIARSVGARGG